MAVETDGRGSDHLATAISYLQGFVLLLAALLALSLLVVGVVAVVAQLKGTWHWSIHLESTISYLGLFVSRLLVVLVPSFLVLVVGRRVVDDA